MKNSGLEKVPFFLLNKRQEKYIEGQLKLIDLTNKLQKERLNYLLSSNQLAKG